MTAKNTSTALIDDGLRAHQSGDLGKARTCYGAALEHSPDNPEALHLLGLVCEQEGDRENALSLIERAVAADPKEPVFRINLAAICDHEGRYEDAVKHLSAATEMAPNDDAFQARLGAVNVRRGDIRAAREAYDAALKLNPDNIDAHFGRGECQIREKNYAGAMQTGRAIMKKAPSKPRGYRLAGVAATALRDWRALLQIGEQFQSACPGDIVAIRFIANAHFELGDTEKARNAYEIIVRQNPDSAVELTHYGRYCLSVFDYDAAERALEKAWRLAPDSTETLYALSRLKLFLGELEESEKLCAAAIKADPEFSPAYAQYTKLRNGDVSPDMAGAMQRIATRESIPDEHKASLFFALGEVNHRRGDYKVAMAAIDEGNQISDGLLRAEGLGYEPAQYEKFRSREFQVFTVAPVADRYDPAPVAPIFIVGMPRSGTTLIESVLAAHPNVIGAGEHLTLPAIHREVFLWAKQSGAQSLSDASPALLKNWRRQYFDQCPKLAGKSHVADKQLVNFRSIGLIRTLFPEAAIVHMRRNPVETGFSIYRNDFGKAWPFATRLGHIAHYYGDYARIMEHWAEIAGEGLAVFQYEEVTANFEAEARRLVEHCGLDWRDECLEFHRVKRPVATFSSTQVRKPLMKNKPSIREQYGPLLQTLIDGLQQAGIDLETGALRSDA